MSGNLWPVERNDVQALVAELFPTEPAFVVRRHRSSGRYDLHTADNAAGVSVLVKAGPGLEAERRAYRLTSDTYLPQYIGSGPGYIVTEYLSGAPNLQSLAMSDPQLAVARVADLARFLADLHAKPVPSFQSGFASVVPSLDPLPRAMWDSMNDPARRLIEFLHTNDALSQAYRWAAETPHADRYIHGDLKVDNVLNRDGQLMVVDWELSGSGPPGFDLGAVIGSLLSIWLDRDPRRPDGAIEAPGSFAVVYGINRFVMEYRDTSPLPTPTDEQLAWWTATWLVARALATATRSRAFSATLHDRLLVAQAIASDPGHIMMGAPL